MNLKIVFKVYFFCYIQMSKIKKQRYLNLLLTNSHLKKF